jgi:hypothetical protein
MARKKNHLSADIKKIVTQWANKENLPRNKNVTKDT